MAVKTYIVLGSSLGDEMQRYLSEADYGLIGSAERQGSGVVLVGAGDVNGDGPDDVPIGSSGTRPTSCWGAELGMSMGSAGFIVPTSGGRRVRSLLLLSLLGACAKGPAMRTVTVAVTDSSGEVVPDARVRIWPEDKREGYSGDLHAVNWSTGEFSTDMLYLSSAVELALEPDTRLVVEVRSSFAASEPELHVVEKRRRANRLDVVLKEIPLPALPSKPASTEEGTSAEALAKALEHFEKGSYDEASELAKRVKETAFQSLSGEALEARVVGAAVLRARAELAGWRACHRRIEALADQEGTWEEEEKERSELKGRGRRLEELALELVESGTEPAFARHLCRRFAASSDCP